MTRTTYYNLILAHELWLLSFTVAVCHGLLFRRVMRDMFGGDVAKMLAEPCVVLEFTRNNLTNQRSIYND